MEFGGGVGAVVRAVLLLAGLLVAVPALAEPSLTLSGPVEVDQSRIWEPSEVGANALATDGSSSLLVYTGGPPKFADTEGYIIGRRWTQGSPADLPFEIYNGAPIWALQLAFDGTAYVLFWTEGNVGEYSLRFMRLDADGQQLTEPETLEESSALLQPAIAAGEAGTLLVRVSDDSVRTWVLTSDGAVEGDSFPAEHLVSPVAGYSDGVWLLAYTELLPKEQSHFVQLGADGHVVPGTASSLVGTPLTGNLDVAAAPDGFVVSREVGKSIDLLHIDFEGKTSVESPLAPPAQNDFMPWPHSLIETPNGYALFYSAEKSGCDDCASNVWMQRLTSKLEATADPVELDTYASMPLVATLTGGTEAVVSWRGQHGELRAAEVTLVDNQGWAIGTAISVSLGDQGAPKVAPGSFGWLAVWPEQRLGWGSVRGVLLDDAGNPDGEPTSLVPEYEYLADLVRGPGGWLMGSDFDSFELHRIADDLKVTDVSVSKVEKRTDPRFAGSADGWLVAWLEPALNQFALRAARLDAAGTVVDSTTVDRLPGRARHQVLYRDGSYEVLWIDSDGEVSSAQIAASGALAVSAPKKLLKVSPTSRFEIARGATGWWGWFEINGATQFRLSDGQSFPEYGKPLPIANIAGLALTGTTTYIPEAFISIGLAQEGGELKYLATTSGSATSVVDISEPWEQRAALTSLDEYWVAGEHIHRITSQIVTVSGVVVPPIGGTGGSGGSDNLGGAEAGGEPADLPGGGSLSGAAGWPDSANAAGADGDVPTTNAGAAMQPTNTGGSSSTSNGGKPPNDVTVAEGGETSAGGAPPRTSSGCGCRVVSGNDSDRNGSFAASLLLGLTLLRRRRGLARAAARP